MMGTIMCIGGAMLLSLYHGKVVIGKLGFQWKYSQHNNTSKNNSHGNFFNGPFLVIISTMVYSLWLIIQVILLIFISIKYFFSSLNLCLNLCDIVQISRVKFLNFDRIFGHFCCKLSPLVPW